MHSKIVKLLGPLALLSLPMVAADWNDGNGSVGDGYFNITMRTWITTSSIAGSTTIQHKDEKVMKERYDDKSGDDGWHSFTSFLPNIVDVHYGYWKPGDRDFDYFVVNYANQHHDVQSDYRCTCWNPPFDASLYARCVIAVHPKADGTPEKKRNVAQEFSA